jgi:hypothetical protein
MSALVVYESMYGNTRQVAEAIAEGLGTQAVPVSEATAGRLAGVDLVVIGGPTHAWGMTRAKTRQAAADGAAKPGSGLTLEPHATDSGVREWLAEHAGKVPAAAVFDTRIGMPAMLTGRASRRIARALRRAGVTLVRPPQSVLVSKQNRLLPGELDRAGTWGSELATSATQR